MVWLRVGPKGHGQDSRQGDSASISHCPPAGVGRVPGWWQKAWVSCSCPTYGFEWFSVQGTWPLCLCQSLAAGRHKAKGKWAPWVRRIGSCKTKIPLFPFPKSHCPAPGGWPSPSPSLPQRFTMYPMAWSHRRDTPWQHPTGAQALGCTQHPHPLGSPEQSSTGLGQLKRD